ncbi:MAG: DUF4111 domain-containing protein [Defluviitaleaceae bacterium]|nr:DUF4111 domain-containing protein [Defluviitaleaceae bacterium]
MEQSINIMVNKIKSILNDNEPSILLYGSVVHDDFKLGWSDIDFICLTSKALYDEQANELVDLRQTLLENHPENLHFKLFEGVIMTLEAFINNTDDTIIYWGTSGRRIIKNWRMCPFGKMELLENGKLLCGSDFRHLISYPTRQEIVTAIKDHYRTIRQHGKSGNGWFLDIARCLYTIKTNKIITKTKAGEWALQENICPDISIMEKIIKIRKNPLEFNNEETKQWQNTLGEHIQKFADILKAELRCH